MSVRGLGAGPLALRVSCEGSSTGGSSGLRERLVGVQAPALRLPFAPGEPLPGSMVSLEELARRDSLAVFFYSGGEDGSQGRRASVDIDTGPRVAGWHEREAELGERGYEVVGVSEQSSEAQAKLAHDRMVWSFTFLSDNELLLAGELGLPTRRGSAGEQVYEPLTILIRDGRIWWVFHPLTNPAIDAEMALERIRRSHG